jgi:hypothetical protein
MMGLSFSQVPRLVQALRCEVCHRLIDFNDVDETKVEAKLFGAKKYAVCSCCGMETLDRSHGYKMRWTLFRKRK